MMSGWLVPSNTAWAPLSSIGLSGSEEGGAAYRRCALFCCMMSASPGKALGQTRAGSTVCLHVGFETPGAINQPAVVACSCASWPAGEPRQLWPWAPSSQHPCSMHGAPQHHTAQQHSPTPLASRGRGPDPSPRLV